MACCAFALYILAHFLLPFFRVKRMFSNKDADAIYIDSASSWTLDAEPAQTVALAVPNDKKARRFTTTFSLFIALEAALIVGILALAFDGQNPSFADTELEFLDPLHAPMCRALGNNTTLDQPGVSRADIGLWN